MKAQAAIRYVAHRSVPRHAGTLVIAVQPGKPADSGALMLLDATTQRALRSLLKRGDLESKAGKTLLVPHIADGRFERVLMVAQPSAEVSAADYRTMINAAVAVLAGIPQQQVLWLLTQVTVTGQTLYGQVRLAIATFANQYYRFDQLKSKPAESVPSPDEVAFLTDNATKRALELAISHGAALATGMANARDLGNLPSNLLTPSALASEARKIARAGGARLTARVLGEKDMHTLGMGAFLSVSNGSDEEGKLIVLEYKGAAKDVAPVVLLGKGITFDTGGVSIKPAANMDEMKFDMCGAGAVLGMLRTVSLLDLPINLIGVVAAAENMVNGHATRPGDVVTTMSGQTVEILNTDAEGRLVLCDALTYIERYKPAVVIDIATLTGAVIVALGSAASGMWSNNDELAEALRKAGEHSNDRLWPMPLWDDYGQSLKSNFADFANVGGRDGGACIAANFLSRFTRAFAWAHLDVAGTAYRTGPAKGSTGRPMPVLLQFLLERSGALP